SDLPPREPLPDALGWPEPQLVFAQSASSDSSFASGQCDMHIGVYRRESGLDQSRINFFCDGSVKKSSHGDKTKHNLLIKMTSEIKAKFAPLGFYVSASSDRKSVV